MTWLDTTYVMSFPYGETIRGDHLLASLSSNLRVLALAIGTLTTHLYTIDYSCICDCQPTTCILAVEVLTSVLHRSLFRKSSLIYHTGARPRRQYLFNLKPPVAELAQAAGGLA